jgi:endonuclease-3 related protein
MTAKRSLRPVANRKPETSSISGPKVKNIYEKLYAFYGPRDWWPGDTPFEIAVGAILTQNTNWTNVEKAIRNLKEQRVLNAKAMHALPLNALAGLIRPSGYFNIKAKRLRAFTLFLKDHYDLDMARMSRTETGMLRRQLLAINGAGQETADSILLYALERPVFVIDAYTKRIMSRHGVMEYKASYGEYQALFHGRLDADAVLFNEYHALLVSLGKDFCRPAPRCEGCPLSKDKARKTGSSEVLKKKAG